MKKNKELLESLKESQAARRKAETGGGIRTDGRFVGKTIPSKRRKKRDKDAERELRNSPDRHSCERSDFLCVCSFGLRAIFPKIFKNLFHTRTIFRV